MNKVKGINKAIREFNGFSGHAVIMYDKSDNTVWCDVFGGDQSWNEYNDRNIVEVLNKSRLYGDDQIHRKDVYTAINNMEVNE